MPSWLETETKALLENSPPEKLAPADTAAFTLVMLTVPGHEFPGQNYVAFMKVVQHLSKGSEKAAWDLLFGRLPVPITTGLSYPDAQLGQFELIICDAVSVFIRDEVVAEAPRKYLADLYACLRKSSEFEPVVVYIDSIPKSPQGQEFCARFLGGEGGQSGSPLPIVVMRKKARLMQHLAARMGGRITVL